jgi:hypothetical protein
LVLGADGTSGFIGGVSIEADLAGEDGALGFFAGFAKTASDQGLVEAHGSRGGGH